MEDPVSFEVNTVGLRDELGIKSIHQRVSIDVLALNWPRVLLGHRVMTQACEQIHFLQLHRPSRLEPFRGVRVPLSRGDPGGVL